MTRNVTVLISGNGSNLQALIDAQTKIGYKISLVGCNKKTAFGLERASKANIPTFVLTLASFKSNPSNTNSTVSTNFVTNQTENQSSITKPTNDSHSDNQIQQTTPPQSNYRKMYDEALAAKIIEYHHEKQPDLIVLAGFMHILSPDFLNKFTCPIINLHPALPGQFDGIHAIERAFEAYKKKEIQYTGIMVHHVIPQVDAGDVILQEKVEILEQDTLQILEDRMHQVEHQLIVEATKKVLGL